MSFQPLSSSPDIFPDLSLLDDLLFGRTSSAPASRTFELPPGGPAPTRLQGPITVRQAASALAEANEALNGLENYVLDQRRCLYDYVKVRVERYHLLKAGLVDVLDRKPFDLRCQQRMIEGLLQFQRANWALRELLAHEHDQHLQPVFSECFNWIKVARYLKRQASSAQQESSASASANASASAIHDSLFCRFERSSSCQDCQDVLLEIRARLSPDATAAGAALGLNPPLAVQARPTTVAGPLVLGCSPDRKRPLQGPSPDAGRQGLASHGLAGGSGDPCPAPSVKRRLAERLSERWGETGGGAGGGAEARPEPARPGLESFRSAQAGSQALRGDPDWSMGQLRDFLFGEPP